MTRPLKYKSAAELEKYINEYFAKCDEQDKPYTLGGLAMHLDMTRQSLWNYGERDAFFDIVKKARAKCEDDLVSQALKSKVNPTMAIFVLKNDYGWRDQSQLDINADVRQDIVIDIEDSPDDEDFDSQACFQ